MAIKPAQAHEASGKAVRRETATERRQGDEILDYEAELQLKLVVVPR